jgi:hypothetical protein
MVSTSRQFKEGMVLLASHLCISFTKSDAGALCHRSDVVHGRDPWAGMRAAQIGFQIPATLAKNNPAVIQKDKARKRNKDHGSRRSPRIASFLCVESATPHEVILATSSLLQMVVPDPPQNLIGGSA